VIKIRSCKILTYYKSQKDLETTLTAAAQKGEATKWSFRTFKEVKDNFEKSREERKSSRNKRKEALFEKQQRNLSFGSVDSDKIQGPHEWALDGLLERRRN
jgi:hypothetical protein